MRKHSSVTRLGHKSSEAREIVRDNECYINPHWIPYVHVLEIIVSVRFSFFRLL